MISYSRSLSPLPVDRGRHEKKIALANRRTISSVDGIPPSLLLLGVLNGKEEIL